MGSLNWSGRKDSNLRHLASKASTLPTELPPDINHNNTQYYIGNITMSTPTESTSPALNQSDTTDLYMLLKDMKSNTLTDYAVPGLESSLLKNGLFRLFEANRDIEELIQPHSHRFDFMCIVLNGTVENTLYLEAPYNPRIVDSVNQWSRRELKRSTKDGFDGYLLSEDYELKGYRTRKVTYSGGQVYGMLHSQIHSIKFSRGAKVLFIEGPEVRDFSHVIQPVSNGKEIPNFYTAKWMFQPKVHAQV